MMDSKRSNPVFTNINLTQNYYNQNHIDDKTKLNSNQDSNYNSD